MGIYKNGREPQAIFYRKPIIAVYVGNNIVWPSEIQSCYHNGYWLDEHPWTDDTPWTD